MSAKNNGGAPPGKKSVLFHPYSPDNTPASKPPLNISNIETKRKTTEQPTTLSFSINKSARDFNRVPLGSSSYKNTSLAALHCKESMVPILSAYRERKLDGLKRLDLSPWHTLFNVCAWLTCIAWFMKILLCELYIRDYEPNTCPLELFDWILVYIILVFLMLRCVEVVWRFCASRFFFWSANSNHVDVVLLFLQLLGTLVYFGRMYRADLQAIDFNTSLPLPMFFLAATYIYARHAILKRSEFLLCPYVPLRLEALLHCIEV